jgi:hypothetical protein
MKKLILLFSVLFTTMSFAQVPSYVPANGLVGWWPFNGNANDESGDGNNGTVNGATLTSDRNGVANQAYSFDGVDDYIQALNPLSDLTSNFSISCFVNISSWQGGLFVHVGIDQVEFPRDGFGYGYGGNQYLLGLLSNVNWYQIGYQFNDLSTWYHAVVIRSENTLDYFIDGVFVGSNNIGTIVPPSNALFFGSGATTYENFHGKLDDIGIWNRALTQQEITNLYTSTVPVSCLPAYVPTSGLVGYWPFCGNANDESGNGNNGTVNGATLTADRNGVANQAYSFDGDDRIDVGNLNLGQIQYSYTYSTWFRTSSTSNTDKTIISDYNSSSGDDDIFSCWNLLEFNNQVVRFETRNYPNGYGVGSTSPLNNGFWHNMVSVLDRNTGQLELYVDGIFISSTSFPNQTNFDANGFLRFGVHMWSNTFQSSTYWIGEIDDIGIWNRALTPQEITNLYTSTVPPTAAVLSGDATICSGASTNLSVAVTGGTAPYTVTLTDGTNNYTATGASPVSIPVSPTATSTYSIVSVTGGGTGTGNTGTATISINQNPIVSDQVLTVCSDIACVLTLANDINGPIVSTYNITTINSNGLSTSAGTPLVANGVSNSNLIDDAWTNTANAAVDVIYTIVPVSAVGCEGNPFTVTLTINPEPIVSNQVLTVCSDVACGLTLGGDIDGPTASTYNILSINSNGLIPSAGTPLVANGVLNSNLLDDAWTNATNAPVVVIYTIVPISAAACEGNPFTVTITVNALPTATITAGGATTFCSGGSVVLTASGGTSYSWSTGATTQAITATTAGSYTVQVTDNVNGCSVTSAVTVLTITPSSTNTTTVSACNNYTWNGTTYSSSGVYTGTTTNCVTQSLNLTINPNTSSSISQTALDSYTWPVNNQTYTTSGAYTAVIPNAAGCDSTITLNLTMSFTGINDLSTSKLSVYPNPTNGDFTITGLELLGTVSSLSLTDMNGKVVKVLDTKATKFSMASIKPGVYFLNIISGNKQEVLKIVKE